MAALLAGCSGGADGSPSSSSTTTVDASTTTVDASTTTLVPTTSTTATSTPSTSAAVPEPIVIGSDVLSDHQAQLVAAVDAYFVATGAKTLGSGPPDPAEVQTVIDLFEPYGRLIWYNGVVYKVVDSVFADFLAYGGLPSIDPDYIQISHGPNGETSRSSSQLAVFDNQVIWAGHDVSQYGGNGLPWIMVFSFDGDSTRISTLYVSQGDELPYWLAASPSLRPPPFTRDACRTTPTAEDALDLSSWPATSDCFHFWVAVTAPAESQFGPCYFFTGIYTATPRTANTGTSITVVGGSRSTCVKMADIAVGDLVEVWARGHPDLGIYADDIEIIGSA